MLLAACGGHDYEGTYKVQLGGAKNNPFGTMLKMFGDMATQSNIIIGDDYIETDGERSEFDDIFVRESHGKKYLVLASDGEEESWRIIDENTLEVKDGMISYQLVRVEE